MLFVGRVRAEPAERKTFDHVERDRFPGTVAEFDRHREDRRVSAPGQPVCKFVSARIGENRFDFVVAHLLLPESELLRGAVVPHRAARAEAAGVVIAADFDFGERRQLRVVDLRPVQSRGRGGGRYEREFDLTAFDVLPVTTSVSPTVTEESFLISSISEFLLFPIIYSRPPFLPAFFRKLPEMARNGPESD